MPVEAGEEASFCLWIFKLDLLRLSVPSLVIVFSAPKERESPNITLDSDEIDLNDCLLDFFSANKFALHSGMSSNYKFARHSAVETIAYKMFELEICINRNPSIFGCSTVEGNKVENISSVMVSVHLRILHFGALLSMRLPNVLRQDTCFSKKPSSFLLSFIELYFALRFWISLSIVTAFWGGFILSQRLSAWSLDATRKF